MKKDVDGLLRVVVLAATKVSDKRDGLTEFSITISVNGTLVTGTIISPQEYKLSNPMLDVLDDVVLKQAHDEGMPKLDFNAVFNSSEFIHLKNAFFEGRTPQQNTAQLPLGYFRAKLSSVDGFSLW